MLKGLVEARGNKRRKKAEYHQGSSNYLLLFDILLNQIPDNWHLVTVMFRRANGVCDGDRERSIGWIRWGDR
jgi:hypothetical protein